VKGHCRKKAGRRGTGMICKSEDLPEQIIGNLSTIFRVADFYAATRFFFGKSTGLYQYNKGEQCP